MYTSLFYFHRHIDTPKVQLFLRSSTASHLVSEEEEVIFECIIESNPIVQHVGWLHNNDILDADLKHGKYITVYK